MGGKRSRGGGAVMILQPHASPSAAGVGTYKPWNGEHIQAVFSLY